MSSSRFGYSKPSCSGTIPCSGTKSKPTTQGEKKTSRLPQLQLSQTRLPLPNTSSYSCRPGSSGSRPGSSSGNRTGIPSGIPASSGLRPGSSSGNRTGIPSGRPASSGPRPGSSSGNRTGVPSFRPSSSGSRPGSSSGNRTGVPSSKSVTTKTTLDGSGRMKRITTVTETFEDSKPGSQPPRGVTNRPSYTMSAVPKGKKACCCAAKKSVNQSGQRASLPKVKPCSCAGKQANKSAQNAAPSVPPQSQSTGPPTGSTERGPSVEPESSLERLVSEELREKSFRTPGSPVQAQRIKRTTTTPPVVMTPAGRIQPTHQMTTVETIDRSADAETIKKHMTAIEVGESGQATKYEMSMQNIEPGGLSRTIRPDPVVHETVSITTNVTASPEVRIRTKKTVHEATRPTAPEISEEEIGALVEEEIRDVENISRLEPPELKGDGSSTFGLKKKLQKMKFNPESVRRLESSIVYPPINADEAQEETEPELLAAIMHTEEQGLNMDSAPPAVYNYLFPNVKDDLLMEINPVVSGVLQNAVVPTAVPSEIHVSGVTPELEFTAVEATECGRRRPPDNLYSHLNTGTTPAVNNTAMKGKTRRGRKEPYLVLTSEEPPWEIEDIQPMINLVGAVPLKTMTVSDVFEEPTYYHEVENVLEYHLIPQRPQHVSRVQLRGSQQPSWFPGYYMALPDNIKVLHTPADVLPAAWQAVQPDIFSDDSFLIVG